MARTSRKFRLPTAAKLRQLAPTVLTGRYLSTLVLSHSSARRYRVKMKNTAGKLVVNDVPFHLTTAYGGASPQGEAFLILIFNKFGQEIGKFVQNS